MNKVYLLQFFCYSDYDLHTVGIYSSIENILQIDTEKEFNLSDGVYCIVEFEINSTQSKTLKNKTVWSTGKTDGWQTDGWQDKVVD